MTPLASPVDSGLQALVLMAGLHGIATDEAQLAHEFGPTSPEGVFDAQTIRRAAEHLGMSTRLVKQRPERLEHAPLPAIAQDTHGAYFLVVRFDRGAGNGPTVLIHRIGEPTQIVRLPELLALWRGELIFFKSRASYAGEVAKFDFTWFIPAVIKYRRLLRDVLVVSFVLQIVGLTTPLFFQVVMDKVLVNHALKTLNVIAAGLVLAVLFDVVLTGIRSWVFAHTSSKIDVELGARLFSASVGLADLVFQARRVGDSVARVRELENIRSFLTGNAMTLVMDLVFSIVFIAVMSRYSWTLTAVVLVSIPLYGLLSLGFTPMLRTRLNDKFNRGAENQAFLVETINGIDTVKSMAVEPRWIHRWEQQLAAYVSASLRVSNVATVANGGVTLVSKMVSAAIMWLGASLVIDGKLSVGELIAFNMLAGQVSAPVLRMAQLWNDFQQVGISMQRLGDILNARAEVPGNRARLPRLAGAIAFDQVSFKYRPEAADVIRNVTLDIGVGEIVGIVGRSGSGKSTLTKLVQRLYVPDRGRVSIDGHDLAVIDTASLRHQIGVVLQENMLFSRSIRENIALSNPALPLEAVVESARLAGAHEFICELPEGYDTLVGEHGSGLSGGQRQRIAIARALITNPRILIFDEATSALDYESEKVIQDNMRYICRGRTVIIIAHRLSAVRDADRIVVMERGEIAEMGKHSELLARVDGIYAHLHRLQHGHPSPPALGAAAPPLPPPPPAARAESAWPREFSGPALWTPGTP